MTRHGQRPRRRSSRLAFTLIEVLLVLMILVILGAIVVPMYSGIQSSAETKAARAQIDMLEAAIDMYDYHAKKFPASLNDLVQRPGDVPEDRWVGPYIKDNKVLVDPWDNPYKFTPNGKHNANSYDVWSMGPDGQDGSADDIGNWKS
jgi:general secretion pathway protein G